MGISGLRKLVELVREPARKQKITIFLLCFFCSAVFWLFIRLSGNSQASFSRVVSIVDLPAGTMVLEQSDRLIEYSVQTTGARLFASRFSSGKDTLKIGLSSMSRLRREDQECYFLTARSLLGILSQQADPANNILHVAPDTLFVSLTRMIEIKVPVKAMHQITFEPRFGLYGEVKLTPDSVVLTGPESMIDTVSWVATNIFQMQNLDSPVTEWLNIRPPVSHPTVSMSPDKVSMHVPVEEYTESQLDVSLYVHCPDSLDYNGSEHIRLFPNKVTLVFRVALRDYQLVEPALFQAFVECPAPDLQSKRLPVMIGYVPDFVKMEAVRPESVDYLIMN